jgi:hypothetical protein
MYGNSSNNTTTNNNNNNNDNTHESTPLSTTRFATTTTTTTTTSLLTDRRLCITTPSTTAAMMNASTNDNNNNNTTPSMKNGGGASSASGMAAAITQFAQATFTKENIERAGTYTRDKAVELRNQAQEGDQSLRVLGLMGGIATIGIGVLELITRFLRLDMVAALIDLYIVILGIIVVVLEGKNILLSESFVEKIFKYAMFLKFLWGRGTLYFVCGTLQLYQIDLLNLIVGVYMCFVGGLYIIVGQRTATKLKSLRKSIYSDHILQTMYCDADVDHDGLDLLQFRGLCNSLGLDLTRRETEAAFAHIQKSSNSSKKLSFQDFQSWWNESSADEQIDENAFVFV